MYRQFGTDPAKASDNQTVQDFRYKVLRELKKIKLAWPDLNYTTGRGVRSSCPQSGIAPVAAHATAGPIALRKPQEWSARRCFWTRRRQVDGKKADNPHRGRRQGDPWTFVSRGFRYAGLPLKSEGGQRRSVVPEMPPVPGLAPPDERP